MISVVVYFIIRAFYTAVFFFTVRGKKNLPKGRGYFVCPNHTSNWDPVTVAAGMGRPITYMAKEELFRIPVVKQIIKAFGAYPIRRGKSVSSAVKTALEVVRGNKVTIVFPEGRRVKRGERGEAKNTIIRLAIQAGAPIVPVGITGRYVPFTPLKMVVGKPIYYEEYYEKTPDENELARLTAELMDAIYSLTGKKRRRA